MGWPQTFILSTSFQADSWPLYIFTEPYRQQKLLRERSSEWIANLYIDLQTRDVQETGQYYRQAGSVGTLPDPCRIMSNKPSLSNIFASRGWHRHPETIRHSRFAISLLFSSQTKAGLLRAHRADTTESGEAVRNIHDQFDSRSVMSWCTGHRVPSGLSLHPLQHDTLQTVQELTDAVHQEQPFLG